MKTSIILYFLLITLLASCSLQNKKQEARTDTLSHSSSDAISSIDITQAVDKQEIILQEVADVEYIPLETNEHVLLETSISLIISNQYILAFNKQEGGIYLFNRKGKILHWFNHKGGGPEEYVTCLSVTMDEQLQEIYIVDDIRRKAIRVYNMKGEFKRSIIIPFIPILSLTNINEQNLFYFDISSLLYDEKRVDMGNYRLISKATGHLSEIPIKLEEEISPTFQIVKEDGVKEIVAISINTILKNGDEIIIADFGSDTIYSYKNQSLKPLLVKTPSIKTMEIPIMVAPILRTNRYLFLMLQKRELNSEKQFVPNEEIAYDFELNKSVQIDFLNRDFYPEKSVNFMNTYIQVGISDCVICSYKPSKLIEEFYTDKLRGELKNISSKLKEDDNPVIMIAKFKK